MTFEFLGKIVICTFEVLMFYDYQRNILTFRSKNRYINVLLYSLIGIAWFCINSLDNSIFNLIGIAVVLVFFSLLLYSDKLLTILAHVCIFWCIMTSVEFLFIWAYLYLSGEKKYILTDCPTNELLYIFIIKIATFCVFRIAKAFFMRNKVANIGSYFKYILILPLTTCVTYSGIFYMNLQVKKEMLLLLVGCIMLLFSNIFVFYILEKLGVIMEQNKLYEIERLQYELNKQHYDRIDEINSKTNKYVHNLKEHLMAIGRLAKENRNEEIIGILGDMETNINIIVNKNYTDNRLMNAILCEKEQLAVKKGISMDISAEPHLELDFINPGDLIVMTGNLLQNAIDAAEKCETGYVNVNIGGSEDRFITVIVENNYAERIESNNGKYLSSKRGYREYGLGIHCVEETVNQYGGMLYLQYADGIFKAILTIAKSHV